MQSRVTQSHKLFFLASTMLVAINLILLSVIFASKNSSQMYAFGKSLQGNVTGIGHSVGDSFYAIFSAARQATTFAVNIVDLHAVIKPADNVHVPVITPVATVASKVSPAAVTQSATPQPATLTATVQPLARAATPPSHPSTANLYAWGNCTWWAASRRAHINDPIPNSWGNAVSWAARANGDGYAVDHHPGPGAIMQLSNAAGGLGHVAFVESVDPDGTWHISEMNVAGLGVVDYKAMPASAASGYNFIHDKG